MNKADIWHVLGFLRYRHLCLCRPDAVAQRCCQNLPLRKEACFTSNPSLLSLPQISLLNLFLGKSSCLKEKSYCSASLPTFKYTTTAVNKQLTSNFARCRQLTQHSAMTSVSKHSEPICGPLTAVCTYLMQRFAFVLVLLLQKVWHVREARQPPMRPETL